MLGVRPEHLDVGLPEEDGLSAQATVDVVEFLGNDTQVHVSCGDLELVATVDASEALKVGDTVALRAPSKSIYLFDPGNGVAITES